MAIQAEERDVSQIRKSKDRNLHMFALNVAAKSSKIGKKTDMSGLWLSTQCYSGKESKIGRRY